MRNWNTWPGVPLVLQGSVYIRACKILVFQSGKEEELPSSNFQLGK